MNILYLASKSKPRQRLLDCAQITYYVVEHTSTECDIPSTDDFHDYVTVIAQDKMDHVTLPKRAESEGAVFVLTADTLLQVQGVILGKPSDEQDARRMIRFIRGKVIEVVTACCLQKCFFVDKRWEVNKQQVFVVRAQALFNVSECDLDEYFKRMPESLFACGGGVIEGYGQNFLKSINGSYTTILGLPLYELREELQKIGFFS